MDLNDLEFVLSVEDCLEDYLNSECAVTEMQVSDAVTDLNALVGPVDADVSACEATILMLTSTTPP
jgi:hypothetical protein